MIALIALSRGQSHRWRERSSLQTRQRRDIVLFIFFAGNSSSTLGQGMGSYLHLSPEAAPFSLKPSSAKPLGSLKRGGLTLYFPPPRIKVSRYECERRRAGTYNRGNWAGRCRPRRCSPVAPRKLWPQRWPAEKMDKLNAFRPLHLWVARRLAKQEIEGSGSGGPGNRGHAATFSLIQPHM